MRNFRLHIFILLISFGFVEKSIAQSEQTLEKLGYLLDDALIYSRSFITPATDAAVYQASSNWINTPKKKSLWDVSLGIHFNLFFVPNSNRDFLISNETFSFFTIENQNSAIVPTAIGDDNQLWLVGDIDGNEVRVKTPEGLNQETVFYSFLQGSLGLFNGTELVLRYSSKVKLKSGNFEVYGVGLKHNLSQYSKKMEANRINLAGLVAYSKEDINLVFLNINSSFGDLGLNCLNGLVDTWQFQLSTSKEFNNFEIISSFITNYSNFNYRVSGPKGEIEKIIPFQSIINKKLEELSNSKMNYVGEVGCRYQIKNLSLQNTFAFGKFFNTNFSIQYEL